MDISNYKPNGTFWTYQEDEQLNNLYNEKLMDIIEISNIIKRMPGSIISRLCRNKYIPNRTSARGYIIYKNSELYKSIVSLAEEKKIHKHTTTSKTGENISININGINTCEYTELKNNVNEIKKEIKELKNDVKKDVNELKNEIKELIEMIKAIYDFDS
jgi:hypothetical protein